MFTLALDLSRWLIRRFVWLLLILAILWAGWLVQSQLNELSGTESSLNYLKGGEAELRNELNELKKRTEQSVANLKGATIVRLDQRIAELTKQIDAKNVQLLELESILNKLNPAKHLDTARLKIEIALAAQELEHLRYFKEISFRANEVGRLSDSCEKIRLRHVAEWQAYLDSVAKLASFNAAASVNAKWNPLSDEYSDREALEVLRDGYAKNTQMRKAEHVQCLERHAAAKRFFDGLEKAKAFSLSNAKTQAVLVELGGQITSIQQEVDKHWLKPILFDPLKQVFPIALGILAMAIFIPFAIKLCLYFVLAPLAARQAPICLLPHSETNIQQPIEAKSAVSLATVIGPDTELVVLPQYFHSAPEKCRTTLRYLLNKKYRMTSLAAGMYNLTAVQADESCYVTVSAGQESLTELIQIEIGEGSAVTLRPRNLVGVIHKRKLPIRITSHWRLWSLQAWLTMQLRYLVFHGPATIIVKGCRGVRVESATAGRAVEQVSTIGFSANLDYSTSRTETVMAYLTGKKGLLRDRFSGNAGFFIYEEMPDPTKRSGVTGKGIEGISDALLKLFGV
jgi:hypothetical protein